MRQHTELFFGGEMRTRLREPRRSYVNKLAVALVCAVSAICSGQPSYAQIIVPPHTAQALHYCIDDHLYNSKSANAPAIIADSLKGRGNVLTFRTCTDADGNTHYFVRKPRPSRNGICRIFEGELFPGTAQDLQIIDILYDGTTLDWYFTLPGWKSWPPEDWEKLHYAPESRILAQEGDGACPPGDDTRYVQVGTTTDGMLKAFFKLWRDVSSAPDAFDKAFAGSTSTANIALGFREDHDALVRALRNDLFGQNGVRPVLQFIDCNTIGRLDGCQAGVGRFVIGFDVGDHGLAITRLDPVLVT